MRARLPAWVPRTAGNATWLECSGLARARQLSGMLGHDRGRKRRARAPTPRPPRRTLRYPKRGVGDGACVRVEPGLRVS
jgi:hypothetical protein